MPYRHWEAKVRQEGLRRTLAKQDACAHPEPFGGRRTNNLYDVTCQACGAAVRTYVAERDGQWRLIHARPGFEPKDGGDFGP